jgi:deoxyribodipyrimidine photo-lyase
MTSARRTRWSFGLQHAAWRAEELRRPLLILEALRIGYLHASDRHHRFVVDGMRDNARAAEAAGVTYYPYVEPEAGHGRGLLAALARRAALVVTDEAIAGFLPRMLAAAVDRVNARFEVVDGQGVLPLTATERAFPTAHGFRRHLQRTLPAHLALAPIAEPLQALNGARAIVPPEVRRRWPSATPVDLGTLPIDHEVPEVPYAGGQAAASAALERFLGVRLARYADRSHPDVEAASGLSPWLHFGHVSPHEIVHGVLEREGWTPAQASSKATGSRAGWWGLSAAAEGFLDQIVTWRELGSTWAWHRPRDYDQYASIPDWARRTLAEHARDPRDYVYALEDLENAATHDEVWNAAQRQLRAEGRIDNYPRMLWGKNVLAWSRDPEEAAETLKRLNDRWAVDGRDPNSYSGIFWVFGRHDRAWGPEREVFGKVRYMTSANTKRKLKLKAWLARWSGAATQMLL